jgi:hypothetical protein
MRYVVRLRYRYRGGAENCANAVAGLPGVRVMVGDDPNTVQIETTPDVVADLKRRLGEHFIVEPEIRYDQLSQTSVRH